MEAVPKLPMTSFELKASPEATSFHNLKQCIAEYYHEDPESYSKEFSQLEQLRGIAVRPRIDLECCNTLKRYYAQLQSLQNRFPLSSESDLLSFTWKEIYSGQTVTTSNIKYEMAAILFDIGALHTKLAVEETRNNPESMKIACTHFQCASWAFGTLKDTYTLVLKGDMSTEILIFMQQMCFAQAQECILEKSLADNRKSAIIAKVAAQVVSFYNISLSALFNQSEDSNINDIVGNRLYKDWIKYIKFKISYLSCILLLYQGQSSEEQQKMGERVTLFNAAFEKLEEAKKESKGMTNIDVINEALVFTQDVVEGKRKAAKNENDFIYHEEIPDISTISAVQGANLVTGIGFDVSDPEIIGDDIFKRLVPMKTHENSSLYSEEKAIILRRIGCQVEDKDIELNSFMSSLNIDSLNAMNQPPDRLPQGLVDRCAELSAKPNAIPNLVQSMSNLADSCVDVETMLNDIKHMLDEEAQLERTYQKEMGTRPTGGHISELNREFVKYLEAHSKAGESNETLRKAMELHVSNLKILAQPLADLQNQMPKSSEKIDVNSMKELKMLLNKVNEMRVQRNDLYTQLRDAINSDDITAQLVVHGEKNVEELFKKELKKYHTTTSLIEQNLMAQSNILKALTDTYAQYAPFVKVLNDTKIKRELFHSSLVASYDIYEDLLSKSSKGSEFYKKLQGNVQKLASRVKAARDVQDEERQQMLKSSTSTSSSSSSKNMDRQINQSPNNVGSLNIVSVTGGVGGGSAGPKLKDYLKSGMFPNLSTHERNNLPSRPTPVGSENVMTSCVSTNNKYKTQQAPTDGFYGQQQNYPITRPFYPNSPSLINSQGAQTNTTGSSFNQQPTGGYTNPIYQNPYYGQQYSGNTMYTPEQGGYPAQLPSPALSNVSNDSGTHKNITDVNLSQNFDQIKISQPTPPSYYTHSQRPYEQQQQQVSQIDTNVKNPYNNSVNSSLPPSYASLSSTPGQNYLNYGNFGQQLQKPLSGTQSLQYSSPLNQQSPIGGVITTTTVGQYGQYGQYYNNQPQSSPAASATDSLNYGQTPAITSNPYYGQLQYQPASSQQTPTQPIQQPFQSQQPVGHQNQNLPSYTTAYVPTNVNIQANQSNGTDLVKNTAPQNNNQQYNLNTTGYQYGNTVTSTTQPYSQQPGYSYVATTTTQQNYTINPYAAFTQAGMMNQPPVNPVSSPAQLQQLQQQQIQYNNLQYAQMYQNNNNVNQYNTPISSQASEHVSASTQPTSVPAIQPVAKVETKPETVIVKSENIDLLSGIDFTVPTIPTLQPLQPMPPIQPTINSNMSTDIQNNHDSATSEILPPKAISVPIEDRKASADNLSILSDISSIDPNFDWESASMRDSVTELNQQVVRDPFENQTVLKDFHKRVEQMEKTYEALTIQTLNGVTLLDTKWKELQDLLVKDESKRTVAVARLFPDKNRSTDSLPYDHARVCLPTNTDNYINAVNVKDLGPSCPTFIMTQTPLTNTITDYWEMIWSQKSNTIVCLHTPNEILDPFWPDLNKEVAHGDFAITTTKQFDLSHCIERSITVTKHGSDAIMNISLMQIKLWKKDSTVVLGVANNIITSYKQQNSNQKQILPIVMNCLTGAERCGIVSLGITAILATQSKRPILINIVDVWYRICSQRKGAMNDASIIKLSIQLVINNGHNILNKRGIMTSYQMKNASADASASLVHEELIKDPLSFEELDPLWRFKK